VKLNIFEPPRFFEAFLRGRNFSEAPDMTSRICGICPVAYQMSAVAAVEDALGVTVEGPLAELRKLLYCGEWIESHTLHITMLHAPDFLGYPGVVEMARDHPEPVRRGLALKKAGNALMELLGGRSVHPINVRVGGFYRVPGREELLALADTMKRARDDALVMLRWAAGFDFPAFERDYTFVSLRHARDYARLSGRLVSSAGLDRPIGDFDTVIEESQVPHSTALHARLTGGGPYLTGALARYANNFDRLWPLALAAAKEAGLGPVCRNPFQSILVRAVEVVQACDEAVARIEAYRAPDAPSVAVVARAGVGHGASEAPRGLLYHRYAIDASGILTDARIVPPTSQNQASIEADLRTFAPRWLALDDAGLQERCEAAIRNHDPCISCATHFLKLKVDRA
jgi:sulfhydrogenase subunit alpha